VSGGFRDIQLGFAAYLRNPDSAPPPTGVEARRLKIYRDLFYNTMEGFLRQGFPVLHRLLRERDQWHPLVREFFATHPCQSPYFKDIPGEFVGYLGARGLPLPYPPYVAELAHYEWLELVLDVAADGIAPGVVDPDGDLLAGRPALNPIHRLASYRWPVTTIAPGNEPHQPLAEPLQVLLFRDHRDRVRFLAINAATHALVAGMAERPDLSGRDHLAALAAQWPQLAPEQVSHFGAGLLADFRRQGLVLGTWSRGKSVPDPELP